MKEIFNNLAFRSTLVCLSITKKHFWLCSQTQRTKKFLFVSETFFINKLNAKRFFKNILKNSKKQTTFRRYTTPLSSQNDKS